MKTKEDVYAAIWHVFKGSEERKITGYRGCITRGLVGIEDFSHCGNEQCSSCNIYSETLKEQLKKYEN